MQRFLIFAAGIGLVLLVPQMAWAGKCSVSDPFPYESPYEMEECPADIQMWMDRANGCTHYAGEETTDDERAAEIGEAMNELQCEFIGCDYTALLSKYEGDVVFTGILTGYEQVLHGGQSGFECESTESN